MEYVFKVWFFTITAAPILIALIFGGILSDSSSKMILESYEMFFIMLVVGFVLSLPAMVIFGIITKSLENKFSIKKKKFILSLYAFTSVWITFYIVDKGYIIQWSKQTLWVLSYSVTIVIAIWIFKIPTAEISD